MARHCWVSGKSPLYGNNVSHANNKNRRRFEPNLQMASLLSDSLGRTVRLRLTTNAIRTIEHRGGLDSFLLSCCNDQLPPEVRQLKKAVVKARARREAADAVASA